MMYEGYHQSTPWDQNVIISDLGIVTLCQLNIPPPLCPWPLITNYP